MNSVDRRKITETIKISIFEREKTTRIYGTILVIISFMNYW